MRASRVAVVSAATAAVVLGLVTPAQAATSSSRPARVRVPNIQPALTGAHRLGAAPAGQAVGLRLYLAGRDPAGLAAAVKAVSTPGSARYRQYLTPAQVRDRYAADAATVAAVRSFLTGYGLKVTGVPGNRTYVDAQGTVAQVQKAFGASLQQYAKNGTTIRATTSAVTVPSTLAGKVTAVSGLSSRSARITPSHVDGPHAATAARATAARASTARTGRAAPPPDAFVNAPPCSAYWAQKIATTRPTAFGKHQPYAPCGYTPSQIQGAYGLTSSLTHGLRRPRRTVAITDAYAAPTILADANTYAVKHGQKPFAKGSSPRSCRRSATATTTPANKDLCGEQGWYGEETLDVEAVHAMAPGREDHSTSPRPRCDDDDFARRAEHDRRQAPRQRSSRTPGAPTRTPAGTDDAYQQSFSRRRVEGIGFYFSSGDNGDERRQPRPPHGGLPRLSPLVTAVGGTVARRRQGTTTLRDRLEHRQVHADRQRLEPDASRRVPLRRRRRHQHDVRPARLPAGRRPGRAREPAGGGKGRVVPDVSVVGDPNTGMLVGETQTFPDGRSSTASTASAAPRCQPALRRDHGDRRPGLGPPARLRQPGAVRALRHERVLRPDAAHRPRSCGSTTSTASTRATALTTSLRSPSTPRWARSLRVRHGYDDITGVGTPNGAWFLGSLGIVR